MLLHEIQENHETDLEVVLQHIIDNVGIHSHISSLMTRHPDCVYKGPMLRWISGTQLNQANKQQFASWSKSIDGMTQSMDNLASRSGYTGLVLKQVGVGFDINCFLDKFSNKIEEFLDEDDFNQLSDFCDEEEIIAGYNNPQTIATTNNTGKIIYTTNGDIG